MNLKEAKKIIEKWESEGHGYHPYSQEYGWAKGFIEGYTAATQQAEKLVEALNALAQPDGKLYGPLTDGPELNELNGALAEYTEETKRE